MRWHKLAVLLVIGILVLGGLLHPAPAPAAETLNFSDEEDPEVEEDVVPETGGRKLLTEPLAWCVAGVIVLAICGGFLTLMREKKALSRKADRPLNPWERGPVR